MQPPKIHCCSKCNKVKSSNRYYIQRHEISCTGQKARRHLIKDADDIKSDRKFPEKAAAAAAVTEEADSDDDGDQLDIDVDEDPFAMIDTSLFTE
ncbi:hypothetical protein CTI12_AA076210 [Artemisia annua]|uniref:Uncharacterized protein n=1 Tax=Artemisia annua TaxID=35608 RepID=A0A2U1Q4N7_ARTAN|nr:hypothetical protein CTI12_AA076210 [Artemisia annua]